MPSGHVVTVAFAGHVSVHPWQRHRAESLQLNVHDGHEMAQVVELVQVTMLPAPTLRSHVALCEQLTALSSPATNAQVELSLHESVLSPPEFEVHVDEPVHASDTAPFPVSVQVEPTHVESQLAASQV